MALEQLIKVDITGGDPYDSFTPFYLTGVAFTSAKFAKRESLNFSKKKKVEKTVGTTKRGGKTFHSDGAYTQV